MEDEVGDTGPTPALNAAHQVRNTTEAERLRAHGQERLRTPPLGVAAAQDDFTADDDDGVLRTEETAVKKRPRPDPRMTAQTAQTLPPAMVTEESEAPERGSGGGGLRWMIRLMALLVLGLMAGVIWKAKNQKPLPPQDPVAEEVDAGAEEEGVPDAGVAIAALEDDSDAGEEEDDLDGGEEDDADAGAEEPVVDAGVVPDAGARVDQISRPVGWSDGGVDAGVKKVIKKVIKKKKKKKRR